MDGVPWFEDVAPPPANDFGFAADLSRALTASIPSLVNTAGRIGVAFAQQPLLDAALNRRIAEARAKQALGFGTVNLASLLPLLIIVGGIGLVIVAIK